VVPRRYRVILWVVPLVILHWLFVALMPDSWSNSWLVILLVALFWGTMFGHTTLAASWTAFGPGALIVRLPLALGWITILTVAIVVNALRNSQPVDLAVPIGACLFGQWLLLQFPLWGLAIGFGLRLQHQDDAAQAGQHPQQFTIRQLIGLTAIVGVLFGIGRVAAPIAIESLKSDGNFPTLIIFLCAAQVVLTIPLLLAALLHRFAIVGVLVALALIVASVLWEMPLLNALAGGSGVSSTVLIAMNVGTALTMLALLIAVRRNGYSLVRGQRSSVQ
jgi:hypothetical protein